MRTNDVTNYVCVGTRDRNEQQEKYYHYYDFCGTSLDVENFSEGLMCLSTVEILHMSKF